MSATDSLGFALTAHPVLAMAAHPVHEATTASSFFLTSWNFEPGLIVSLLMFAGIYGAGIRRLWRSAGAGKGISRAQVGAFSAGWLALVVALVSPVDAVSDSLLWVHMVQHELLMVVAAPLIALSSPLVAGVWALRLRTSRGFHVLAWLTAPAFVFLLHAFALWIWHLPSLYEAALEHEGVHIAQHICFFSSACLFWWGMLHGRYGRLGYGAAVIYMFATGMHSGVLGALLTVAPYPWYRDYLITTSLWGYTPLEDQQVAGLIMWIPASLVFLVAGLAFLAAWLRESERRVRIIQTRA
jgi:putative membrane protein